MIHTICRYDEKNQEKTDEDTVCFQAVSSRITLLDSFDLNLSIYIYIYIYISIVLELEVHLI